MTTSFFNISTYSRFNLSESSSDIQIFVKEYKDRINRQLLCEEEGGRIPFISFAEKKLSVTDVTWLQENAEKFFKDTPNEIITQENYLSESGFIYCMTYSPDGEYILVGHSTGLIQMNDQRHILDEYAKKIHDYYDNEKRHTTWYPMFYDTKFKKKSLIWVKENYDKFLKDTPNRILYNRWYFTEMGFITALEYSPDGFHVIVGHSSGLIQMRHGSTGVVLCTLRNIQFPPKPVYAIVYSRLDEKVCYAACMDGIIYRIEIPNILSSVESPPEYCIRVDPALECLNMQFYGSPGVSSCSTPFISQRSPALCLGLSSDQAKMVVGYGDASIKIYDMETQEVDLIYKVHKLRLQFIPKKLQRIHFGQVCALRCHNQRPFMFASGAWDKTLRIWDTRCQVGCVMTFEGVDICGDSIDLCRDLCIAGSWQATEALTVWDLVAKKRLNIIRAQNRRADVDGEFIYACRFWNSTDYNRKGKYGIIGGSGTQAVEVINLHNRYISCSYPAEGTILSVTSHQDRIAFGGTAPVFNIVSFHDPKHEKYEIEVEPDFDYTKGTVTLYEDDESGKYFSEMDNRPLSENVDTVSQYSQRFI